MYDSCQKINLPEPSHFDLKSRKLSGTPADPQGYDVDFGCWKIKSAKISFPILSGVSASTDFIGPLSTSLPRDIHRIS